MTCRDLFATAEESPGRSVVPGRERGGNLRLDFPFHQAAEIDYDDEDDDCEKNDYDDDEEEGEKLRFLSVKNPRMNRETCTVVLKSIGHTDATEGPHSL